MTEKTTNATKTAKTTPNANRPRKRVKYNEDGNVRVPSKTAVKVVSKRRKSKYYIQPISETSKLKYITSFPLHANRMVKLPKAILSLVQKEIRDIEGAVPEFGIFIDRKNNYAIIKCIAKKSEELLCYDENDKPYFKRVAPEKLPYDEKA